MTMSAHNIGTRASPKTGCSTNLKKIDLQFSFIYCEKIVTTGISAIEKSVSLRTISIVSFGEEKEDQLFLKKNFVTPPLSTDVKSVLINHKRLARGIQAKAHKYYS
ncbi:Hypothetical protein PP7435_CHR1-2687 [Komagataella phaffii CBS 7435]|uniref:Uncharacterized protein n=2 Tax=Komagataella phaffii TaxID=460519 RepID=C4QXF4_KOMPG|nr:Hypothetical protein PAS_chr1-4_0097 [Komagataella phaffii GS115]CAH2446740.1 Hypothetical protein BQ9382_C1-4580 [Komagataella phaffii CBS 7435]CAY67927.1 Hypothetical protein PAS_chr1-4_0097 [Komagataella phaffii GS115]SCV11869.1 Hypothetical protein PP7435_CHR1-2687 [Komagataella phaffii CBS 7435]